MPDQIVEIPKVGKVAFPDTMSDADISKASHRLYLEALAPQAAAAARAASAGNGLTTAVTAASALRPAAERIGLEAATMPAPAALTRLAGLVDNLPLVGSLIAGPKGAAIGKGIETAAAVAPSVVRGGGGFFARLAASPFARAVTGLPGMLASMPFSEAGDRPIGETAATTAQRTADFGAEYRRLLAQAGKGRTTDINLPALPAPRNLTHLSDDELFKLAKGTIGQ